MRVVGLPKAAFEVLVCHLSMYIDTKRDCQKKRTTTKSAQQPYGHLLANTRGIQDELGFYMSFVALSCVEKIYKSCLS